MYLCSNKCFHMGPFRGFPFGGRAREAQTHSVVKQWPFRNKNGLAQTAILPYNIQLMANWWFGIPGYRYLTINNPFHFRGSQESKQLTISWNIPWKKHTADVCRRTHNIAPVLEVLISHHKSIGAFLSIGHQGTGGGMPSSSTRALLRLKIWTCGSDTPKGKLTWKHNNCGLEDDVPSQMGDF